VSGKSAFKYLKADDIKRLQRLEFSPEILAEGFFAGRHASRGRGVSSEFMDHRPHCPGDDIKLIDWRVLARTDRAHLKMFERETDTVCYIFMDSSRSMDFGGGMTKLDFASYFTAALSWLVSSGGNMVSLCLFDGAVKDFIPPGSSPSHLRNILEKLDGNKPEGSGPGAPEALEKTFHRIKKRGTLVVLSDFYLSPAELFSSLRPYISRGFKIHLAHILTPGEINLPFDGLAEFTDMEDGSKVSCRAGDIRAEYQAALNRHISAMRETAFRKGVSYALTGSDRHYLEMLRGLAK
jgi:uncharacterized protein (DUF58 family)